ncbi:multidrug efflux pump VmrA [Candidatus Methanoplasma termitum]|uniref:Multidrug efflux pump VmrA n=1 Tax=Candidatus Methanoplasma termitum TaxID=1577791 RepID=A0A0A7LB03_9ARCH|nr:MATE family efflux transporter [Candidatus Methanoplasma termitum]AIZ56254.1 multidrug efflux pump VmrA [Candidatus Methanoplasma termitum]MCL2333770.1 MATE family efflux transporter [Candidatus Methanoplasma sp.]
MDGTATKGVDVLLGDPKKAVVAFSIPIAIALLAQQGSLFADSVWVTALGGDALSAIGLVSPMYIILTGIGAGLAVGTSAAIARKIGMKKADSANLIAMQSLLLCLAVAVVLTPLLLLTSRPLLGLIGAGSTINSSVAFATPIYISFVLILLANVMSGIMRGEGAARKSMYMLVLGAVTTIILDPILIYVANLGVAGAGWATSIGFGVSFLAGVYWYFFDNRMFIKFKKENLKLNIKAWKTILFVGVPQSAEFMVMGIFNIAFNGCVILIGGNDVMAIYTATWRVIGLIVIPAQAMGGAIISSCSAEFGMKRYDMIRQSYVYAVKMSLILLTILTVAMVALAGPIATLFTNDLVEPAQMHSDMVIMMYIFATFIPIMALIYVGSSLLQSLARSKISLLSTFIRNGSLAIGFLITTYGIGTLTSMWWALSIVEIFGSILMGYWAYVILKDAAKKDGKSIIYAEGDIPY